MFPPNMLPLAVAALFVSAGTLSAQTFTFTATVDSIVTDGPELAENRFGLVAGDTFTAVLVLDWSAPDYYDGDPKQGAYFNTKEPGYGGAIYRSSLVIYFPSETPQFGVIPPNYTFVTSTPDIAVTDGVAFASTSSRFGTVSGDSFDFHQTIPQVSGGAGYLYNDTVELLLNDSSGTAFTSDGLPRALNLSDFDLAKIYFGSVKTGRGISSPGNVGSNYNTYDLVANVTGITAVPEPSAGVISLVAGGLLLGTRRRRR